MFEFNCILPQQITYSLYWQPAKILIYFCKDSQYAHFAQQQHAQLVSHPQPAFTEQSLLYN